MEEQNLPVIEEENSSSEISGSVSRVAASVLKELGHKRAAEVIAKWPEMAGKAIAAPFKKIQDLMSRGEAIPLELENELIITVTKNDDASRAFLAIVLSSISTEGLDSSAEKAAILKFYFKALTPIVTASIEKRTSFALLGFLHLGNCISYWHFKRMFEKTKAIMMKPNYLKINSMGPVEIFILDIEPTEENLTFLNQTIRESPQRELPDGFFGNKDSRECVKVLEIHELNIIVEEQSGPEDELFGRSFSSNPSNFEHSIPYGAPALPGLVSSLQIALEIQQAHFKKLKETIETT